MFKQEIQNGRQVHGPPKIQTAGCQQLGIYFSVLKHWNMVILIPNYGRYSQTNENFQMIFQR